MNVRRSDAVTALI